MATKFEPFADTANGMIVPAEPLAERMQAVQQRSKLVARQARPMNTSRTAVTEVPTPTQALARAALPGCDFSDAYCGQSDRTGVTAMQVALGMFKDPPGWVNALMSVRDGVVGRFGLKTSAHLPAGGLGASAGGSAGIFPVLLNTPTEVVLGADDKHLDFRIWVQVEPHDGGSRVTASTVVRTHNRFGRLYLATIMPFHRLLSRKMLARAIGRLNTN
jgi:hypothetical protein